MAIAKVREAHQPDTPIAHRSAVTAVDSSDPADASGAIDTKETASCHLDIEISGVSFTSLTVRVLFWNSRLTKWFGGASRKFTSVGKHALHVDTRGRKIWLKVTAFTGTSFQLDADYVLIK